MQITRIDKDGLRRLLTLTEKKEQILESLREVEQQIQKTAAALGVQFVDSTSLPPSTASAKPSRARSQSNTSNKAPSKGPRSEGRSGALKNRIVSLLETAGPQGMRVKDVAKALGVKVANISVWFSTTGKKITTKLAPGVFALKSQISQEEFKSPDVQNPITANIRSQPQAQPQNTEAKPSTEAPPPTSEPNPPQIPAVSETQLTLTEQAPSELNA